jgi:hypothetical protein
MRNKNSIEKRIDDLERKLNLSKKKEKIIINITDLTKVRKKEKGKRYITGKDKKGKFYQEITETYNIKVQPFRK